MLASRNIFDVEPNQVFNICHTFRHMSLVHGLIPVNGNPNLVYASNQVW